MFNPLSDIVFSYFLTIRIFGQLVIARFWKFLTSDKPIENVTSGVLLDRVSPRYTGVLKTGQSGRRVNTILKGSRVKLAVKSTPIALAIRPGGGRREVLSVRLSVPRRAGTKARSGSSGGGGDAPTVTERARTLAKVGWSWGGAVCMAFERKFLINCLVNKSGCVRRNAADGSCRTCGAAEDLMKMDSGPYNIMLPRLGVFQLGTSESLKLAIKVR